MNKYRYGDIGLAAGGRIVYSGVTTSNGVHKGTPTITFYKVFPEYGRCIYGKDEDFFNISNRGVTPSGMYYFVGNVGHPFIDAPPLGLVIRDMERDWIAGTTEELLKFAGVLRDTETTCLAHRRFTELIASYDVDTMVFGNDDRDSTCDEETNKFIELAGGYFFNACCDASLAANHGWEGHVAPTMLEVVIAAETIYGRYAALVGDVPNPPVFAYLRILAIADHATERMCDDTAVIRRLRGMTQRIISGAETATIHECCSANDVCLRDAYAGHLVRLAKDYACWPITPGTVSRLCHKFKWEENNDEI